MKINDLTGRVFDRLTVLTRAPNDAARRRTRWVCQCTCGEHRVVEGSDLRRGHTTSCGCLHTRHGHKRRSARTPTYRSWETMWMRCTKPHYIGFKYYGGRSITVCARWTEFENFLADMNERPLNTTLDRINNDGNYEPSNCRWATWSQQMTNRRTRRQLKKAAQNQSPTSPDNPSLSKTGRAPVHARQQEAA